MPHYKGPKTENLSKYIERSKFPISDGWRERNLLHVYNFWPRSTGKSLFEVEYLGEAEAEKPISRSTIRWRLKRRRVKKLSKKTRLNMFLKSVPLDGREKLMGPRKINPAEHVPSDLARLVRACGDSCDLARGVDVHKRILQSDFRDSRYLANMLVEMYGKCGCPEQAWEIFTRIKAPSVACYNSMIAGLSRNGILQKARELFNEMPGRDLESWNTLVTAYATNGHLEQAMQMFERMPSRGVVSWTALVTGFADHGLIEFSKFLLDQMPERNFLSWNAVLQAYAHAGHVTEATSLFNEMSEQELSSWTSLVTSYISSRSLERARLCFDLMPSRDTTSWNMMIDAYSHNRRPDEARRVFERMACPDELSWPAVIRGYAIAGHLIEAKILFEKCPNHVNYTWNALVAGYAENGKLVKARRLFKLMPHKNARTRNALMAGAVLIGELALAERLFHRMPRPNATAWNVLIHAYAGSGLHLEALNLGLEMKLVGTNPDDVTFVCLLNACVQRPVGVAREVFLSIAGEHFLEPGVDHYTCMIHILGQDGKLTEAEELILNMHLLPDVTTWATFLAACKLHRNVKLGVSAARQVCAIAPSPYLLLADWELQSEQTETKQFCRSPVLNFS